jgi:protein-L-isoaspartate(D-aspartate) O-methyltransferase
MAPGIPQQEDLVGMVAASGVGEGRLLEAFRAVPRAGFVPPEHARYAYVDEPLPIPHGQVTTQPSLVAKMVEALELSTTDKVLEVGSGYGFQTALLARLAARVWSIELWPDIAEVARSNLKRQGTGNVEVLVGDGSAGLPREAPFDAIIVSAAFPRVPDPLAGQLGPGGRLVQPIGSGGHEEVVLFVNGPKGLATQRSIIGARFVRLYGEHGFAMPEAGHGG